MAQRNREYKSNVFTMLMEDKAHALELYNAVADRDYKDPEAVEICTLENGISLTVRNDLSFIVDAVLNIYEHQSTYNPNMPLRNLIYYMTIIKDMIEDENLYGHKLIKIPTPRFAVFYNGAERRPEREIMKLSDAFQSPMEHPELELTCVVYNINPGCNAELLAKSPTLRDYMIFIGYVRENLEKCRTVQQVEKKQTYQSEKRGTGQRENRENTETREKQEKRARVTITKDIYDRIVEEAVDRCIAEGILKEFFLQRREEVLSAMKFDFTYEKRMELEKRDSYEDGQTIGVAKKLIDMITKKMRKKKQLEQIADELEEPIEEIRPIYEAALACAPDYDEEAILKKLYAN